MVRKSMAVMVIVALAASCASTGNDKTKKGAAAGAAAGAVAGAVIGNQSGNNRTGAVVGGVVGAAIGAAIGRRMDQQEQELRQIPGVEVTRPSEGQIDIRLTSDILFDVNSYSLRPESRQTLRDLATTFGRYADINYLDVQGHTDSTGTSRHNNTLSQNRANAVRSYLVEQGVPSSRVVARGFGESQPKASNATAEGRQLNRRVEIQVRAQDQPS